MSNGTGVPDLDTFLSTDRARPCSACGIPPEVLAEITERVGRGVKAWTAYSRWLATQDIVVTGKQLQHHYSSGHHERP